MAKRTIHIALVGNPNSGKSSLFNSLTGLNQKVGNFPGVTMEKKTGTLRLSEQFSANLVDLPGTYSLYPKRLDEWVSYRVLIGQDPEVHPDVFVVVVDASNLKRNLLFCTQIIDLKKPVVLALTMVDLARRKGIEINLAEMERELGVPIIAVNPRKGKGIPQLKKAMELTATQVYKVPARDFIDHRELAGAAISDVQALLPEVSDYSAIHYLINHEHFDLPQPIQDNIESIEERHQFNHTRTQASEIMQRYTRIKHVMQASVSEPDPKQQTLFTDRLDNLLLHRKWGYLILLAVLFLLFQSVFLLAQYPMDWIDSGFAAASGWLSNVLPDGWFSDLLINGVVAGLGGILVFVPQIMILFGLITLLEDTGYMARISFLTDRLMRSVGLNGKSVMPLISGFACAVPAIMSARAIENRKERLLTILVTPLISCSARLPVYVILIGLVIPNTYYIGFVSLQGLVMMGLYLLGLLMALFVSWVAKQFIRINEKSFFILELPIYRAPRWKNVGTTMVQKARVFVTEAGRVIMIISLALWALSTFGPSKRMDAVEAQRAQAVKENKLSAEDIQTAYRASKLEASYAGILGQAIEPAIKPLGYDWRIGISLITSFAAREVFVGTMATLYSVGENDEGQRLSQKLRDAKKEDGTPLFTLATGVSLMIFYVFAMQCMSTLAVVRRETKSWKWPLIQFTYMTAIAYVMSFIAYQIFS
ncbi:ferrous iron transport protein B [Flaviaesturariibacter aridisoli]|uniref:Ferrous iron transport protein B n=1 Tax=Flaviaesturariibacter aridisoli TaxID=2545761 RepID=A0A4V2WMK7_9BACT|nr:ferrous iron transport protein B [Flaviaesturariibacter aridisoli]TCZ70494.1 ferrous iron transport protein B [Flaviaesturariibacter aridisoli]